MEAAYGPNTALRWKDLALDELLPADDEEEQRLKAEQARKMASGSQANNTGPHQQAPRNEGEQQDDEEEEEGEGEEEWEEEPSSAISEYASPETE